MPQQCQHKPVVLSFFLGHVCSSHFSEPQFRLKTTNSPRCMEIKSSINLLLDLHICPTTCCPMRALFQPPKHSWWSCELHPHKHIIYAYLQKHVQPTAHIDNKYGRLLELSNSTTLHVLNQPQYVFCCHGQTFGPPQPHSAHQRSPAAPWWISQRKNTVSPAVTLYEEESCTAQVAGCLTWRSSRELLEWNPYQCN